MLTWLDVNAVRAVWRVVRCAVVVDGNDDDAGDEVDDDADDEDGSEVGVCIGGEGSDSSKVGIM